MQVPPFIRGKYLHCNGRGLSQQLFHEQAKPRWAYQPTAKLRSTVLMYTIFHISCWQRGKSIDAHNSNKCIPYRELQKILRKK